MNIIGDTNTMTKTEAIFYLQQHQPMPNDGELKEKDAKKYEEVRCYFLAHPDERCIPLFLNSFGGKDGLGVYQMVEDVIISFDKNIVLPYIMDALNSQNDSVKYWTAQIASNFPEVCLFEPLVELLKCQDIDIKFAVITALAQIALSGKMVDEVIKVINGETKMAIDEEYRIFCCEVLEDIQDNI